jgi:decaprenylphospho-beta-D-ribofuranose 2-oxidase
MPRADIATAPRVLSATFEDSWVSGWGGGPATRVSLACPETVDQLRDAVSESPSAIARGMGRSYGDAAQLGGGAVLATTRLRAIELDAEQAVVRAEGGATLAALLARLEPAGFVLPVVPGTQHVSVGGAIAADVHGKNHGTAGTFGSHVMELGLLTADGELLTLTPADDLFGATLGGMGLTGIIVWARIRARRVRGAALSVDTDRVRTLDEALAILDGPGGAHRVAWLDLLGPSLVRGVVTRAEHAVGEPDSTAHATVPARVRVPPLGRTVLAPSLVRAFNELRFRRSPVRRRGQIEPFGAHMFPLDALVAWPRLYGPTGFVQYQLVVPPGQEAALHELLVALRRSPVPCYLAVLKDFGVENGAPLSFPLAGWTLALDLPRSAPGLEALLQRFDELVVTAGGRVYLAKDGRLRPETLTAMYPRLPEWRSIRDRIDPERRWRSDLALRTGLVEAA